MEWENEMKEKKIVGKKKKKKKNKREKIVGT